MRLWSLLVLFGCAPDVDGQVRARCDAWAAAQPQPDAGRVCDCVRRTAPGLARADHATSRTQLDAVTDRQIEVCRATGAQTGPRSAD